MKISREATDTGGVEEALIDGERVVEAEEVGEVADPSVASVGLIKGVKAVDLDRASKGDREGSKAAHQGGFSGSIRPDKGGDGFFLDGEGDIKKDAAGGIFKDKIVDSDQRRLQKIRKMRGWAREGDKEAVFLLRDRRSRVNTPLP